MKRKTAAIRRPDGIADEHVELRSRRHRHASPLSLVVLAGLVAAGASGVLGSPAVERTADTPEVSVLTRAPEVIRNGEIYESTVTVDAKRPIGKLVIGVSPELWRDTTVNSMVPAAADESHEDGLFRFAYGRLEAGQRFEVKMALQINPTLHGRNAGRLVVFDDKTRLAELPREMAIRP